MKGVFLMSGFNVRLADGTTVQIKAGEQLDDIKAKFGEEAQNIFEGIDANNNGTLDTNEVEGLKAKFQADENYTVEVAPDGKTPKKAYNDAMQNMRNRYNQDNLKTNFKTDDADKWEIKSGHTLWGIAKAILEREGLPTDARSINDRIAQIANLNNINNVNNIRIGTKLIYKLTEEGVQKVKDAENNSAVAFGGGVNRGVNRGAAPAPRQENAPAPAGEGVNNGDNVPATSDKTSTITVTPNGLNMGSGMPVDKDGNELKDANGKRNFKDPKFQADGSIMKYTSGDTVMYQTTYKTKAGDLLSEVKLSAASIEELKALEKECNDTIAKIQAVADSDSDEVKAQKRADNLAALKELVTITGGNVQVIKNVAEKLRDDNFVDRTSDDYKAFVQDLILTRNADVLRGLFYEGSGTNTAVLRNDKTAHEYLAGVYQEIRAKEKAGEKLTDEEIALKGAVAYLEDYNGYKIEADAENGVHEKYMAYNNMDGILMYQVYVDDNRYFARDEKILDEFLTKLEAADTDDKKTALFKEYANTTDPELARCLAGKAQDLKASNEDMIALVNSHGVEVINNFNTDDGTTYDKTVVDAVVARAKDIYTTDKGNLENAVYLGNVMNWINKTDLSDEDKEKAMTEIAETYFESTTAEDGTKTYTFNPSRIPTQEEAYGLADLPDTFKEALVKYTKLEDMGKGRYNEGIERALYGTYTVPHYAGMVDGMTDKKDVIDFIDNKIACDKDYHIPFDKILEKFPDDADIKNKLFEHVNSVSTITPENAKKFIDMCGKDKLDKIVDLARKNADAAKARIAQLTKANASDKEFIKKLFTLENEDLIPYSTLVDIDAKAAKWDDETKALVFEKCFNDRVLLKDRAKPLDNAVKKGHVTKVAEGKYAVGDTIYQIWRGNGEDNKANTPDDTVLLKKMSKTGYEHGLAMFEELKDAGSGDIARMLRGDKDEEKDYTNYITPDNVTGIIDAFNTKSPQEGLMEYISNETDRWLVLGGVKPGKALCNRIPKALMRKAAAMNLQETEEYKKIAEFFKCSNDGKFTFNQNDEADKRYDTNTAKQLDALINALSEKILQNSKV